MWPIPLASDSGRNEEYSLPNSEAVLCREGGTTHAVHRGWRAPVGPNGHWLGEEP